MKFSQLLGGQNQDMSDPLEGNRGVIPVALFTCSHCCPDAPWDERYIYLHVWLKFMVNVDKNSSPMEPYGLDYIFVSIFFLKQNQIVHSIFKSISDHFGSESESEGQMPRLTRIVLLFAGEIIQSPFVGNVSLT